MWLNKKHKNIDLASGPIIFYSAYQYFGNQRVQQSTQDIENFKKLQELFEIFQPWENEECIAISLRFFLELNFNSFHWHAMSKLEHFGLV